MYTKYFHVPWEKVTNWKHFAPFAYYLCFLNHLFQSNLLTQYLLPYTLQTMFSEKSMIIKLKKFNTDILLFLLYLDFSNNILYGNFSPWPTVLTCVYFSCLFSLTWMTLAFSKRTGPLFFRMLSIWVGLMLPHD